MSKLSDLIARGVLASRPAAGSAGRLYEATDSTPPTVYRDNGASWDTYATAGAATVTTTRGDLIVRGSSADVRLALGAAGKILTSDGTDAVWGNGPMTTKGDLLAGGASGAITRVPVGSDGQVLTADAASTPGLKWAAAAGGGGAGGGDVEKAYAEQTSIVTISATTEAGANTVVTAPAFSADGASTCMIEFYAPFVRSGANGLLWVVLFEDGAAIGAELLQGGGSIGDHYSAGSVMRRKRIPAAGSRTYSVRAYRATANGEVGGGTGAAGDYMPAYLRITQLNTPTVGVFAGAKAYMNGVQAVATGGDRVITFDTEDWDTDGYHDNVTNNGRFTIPAGKGGKYLVEAHIWHTSAFSSDVQFRINGTTLLVAHRFNGNAGEGFTATWLGNLVAGNYIEVIINPDAGTPNIGHASSRNVQNEMSVTLVGGAPVALATVDARLGADVTLVNVSTFYDGPSATLAAGTWLLWWKAAIEVLVATSQSYDWTGRLWDGSTIYDEQTITGAYSSANVQSFPWSMSGFALVVLAAPATLKISVAGVRGSSSAKIARNPADNSGASDTLTRIVGYQIA